MNCDKKLSVLDLFSGIGGFSLGLERTGGFETVAFCEIEEFPRKVLSKHWPDVPIHFDIEKLKGTENGRIDVVCGGFPCQPYSTAGNQLAEKDDRYLWPEMLRVISAAKPSWVIIENVTGLIGLGLDNVLTDLENEGYTPETFIIPACAVNAPHRRSRLWIVGHSKELHSNGCEHNTKPGKRQKPKSRGSIGEQAMAHPECGEREMGGEARRNGRFWESFPWHGNWQGEAEPFLDRENDGLPNRMDRLKGLGNAVLPQITEIIGRAILEIERK